MHILLTNDDGIHSPGLLALRRAAEKLGKVSVIAPISEQSAIAHSITLAHPLHVREVHVGGDFIGLGVNGTPADCVRLAVKELLKTPPDFVISGINPGMNVGFNVLYSGTVAAAMEGGLLGFPSMAVSLRRSAKPDFDLAAEVAIRAVEILKDAQRSARGEPTVLNVNIPAVPRAQLKGMKLTRQGRAGAGEGFIRRRHPRGGYYYWMSEEHPDDVTANEVDLQALREGYVSVTPLHCDLTSRPLFSRLRKRTWKLF